MSKIITPTDTITITIDNRRNPATAAMAVSRDLPIPQVVAVLAQLIAQLMGDLTRRMMGNPLLNPLKEPTTEPPTEPPNA